ncbi:MAG: outer membrane protein, partial [Beijerinckiaceae bacterium]
MKKLILATVAVAGLSTASLAADIPSRRVAPVAPAPVVYAPAFTWTGFYIGVQGGYTRGRTTGAVSDAIGGESFGYDTDGGLFGVHAGYNFQFSPMFVAGVEADAEWSGLSGSGVTSLGAFGHSTDIEWQGSLRGRLGLAFERAMIYATGGLALANIEHAAIGPISSYSYSDTRAGWTLGGGIEYAVTNNVTIRGEYRYADYGRETKAS